MQSIITGPAGSAPSEPGSKDPEEEQRTSSGSSPPSSLPITPEPMSAPDITLQAAEVHICMCNTYVCGGGRGEH